MLRVRLVSGRQKDYDPPKAGESAAMMRPFRKRIERSDAGARPLDEADLDAVAGGKRSQVKDAHDKYANIEVDYTGGKR